MVFRCIAVTAFSCRVCKGRWLALVPLALCMVFYGGWAHASSLMVPSEIVQAEQSPSLSFEEEAAVSTIVVRASRWPAQELSSPFRKALAQSTRFDSQDLEEQAAADVSEWLPQAAGAQIVRAGGVGAAGSVYLRGADAAQTLVLLDGVRIDSASLGRAQLNLAVPDQLERIEVINGNVSALYGGGAVGGVVQLTTRQALAGAARRAGKNTSTPSTESVAQLQIATEYGRYDTQHQHIDASGTFGAGGNTQLYVGASRLKTTGFSAMDPAQTPGVNPGPDGASNRAFNMSLRHQFDQGWEIGARAYDTQSTVSFDQPFGEPTDVHFSHNRLRVLSASAVGPVSARWMTHLLLARSEDGNSNTKNGQFDSRFDTLNHQFTWRNEIALSPTQKGVWGYEHLQQSLRASAYTTPGFTHPIRRVNSAFAGYVFAQGAHEAQLHARQDSYSDVGTAHSVYTGYRYSWSPQWQTSFSASNAFRPPSFNDLYYPDYGNPGVQPERSHSIEATLRYIGQAELKGRSIATDARISAFQTRYRDLIESVQVSPGLYRAQNIGRAKVQGLEMAATAHWGQTEWRVTGTVQNPVEEGAVHGMPKPSRDLPRRARHFASLAFTMPLAQWRVGGDWQVTGRREDAGMPLHGYALFNLRARYALNPAWSVRARMDNLLNRHYQLAYGYQTPGRGAYVELVWQSL